MANTDPIQEADIHMLANDFLHLQVRLAPFTGDGELPFFLWLRKFENLAQVQQPPWTADIKERRLRLYLDGLAREGYETFDENAKSDFTLAIHKIKGAIRVA